MLRNDTIYNLINQLRENNGTIWVENNVVKLNIPEQLQVQEIFDFIKEHKSELTDALSANKIFSEEKFLETEIIKGVISDFYPLSFAQERLWFIEQYEQGTNAYHMPAVYELDSAAEIEGIRYVLQQVVTRHEVLRSTIVQAVEGGHGLQKVHEEPLLIEEIGLTDKEDYESIIREDINRPFDLSSAYPIRVKFYFILSEGEGAVTETRTLLLINIHHIVSDGWSMEIFQKELLAYYNAFIKKHNDFCLPALEIQYKDYAAWQKNYLTGAVLEKQLSYWKEKLSGYQTLELPIDYPRPPKIDHRGAGQAFKIDSNTSRKLRSLTRQWGVTMHSVLLSSINILLSKYTGQDDFVVGSPIANRHYKQTEGLIGFFVNTLVNRAILNKSQCFEELVQQVHREQIQAQLHQDLPFEKLVDELSIERDLTMNPVFQVMVAIQTFGNQDKTADMQKGYLMPFQLEDIYEVAKFDLSFYIDDSGECIEGHINYATSLFSPGTIDRLICHYINLVAKLAAAPKKRYSEVSLLSPEEHQQIVYKWNDTDRDYPKDKTIHQLFQEQVERTPGNIALVYEGQQLTYRELNEKSNQLARYIRSQYGQRTRQEFAANTLVALYLDRSLEMVVGVLAVLKAGGAYVPIDPGFPQERANYILQDTGSKLILSQRRLSEDGYNIFPQDKVIYIDLDEELYKEEDSSDLQQHSKAADLVYVIYTSGTTGKPNGVMISHTGLNNLVFAQKNILEVNPGSKVLQYASLIFDASVFEIFTALSTGALLSIVPAQIRTDVHSLCCYLLSANISVALLPPVLLSAMPYTHLPDLKTLLVGGELCSLETMNRWKRDIKLINAYGPTESTVIATMHAFNTGDKNTNIGKPLPNTRVYVLDNNSVPVPIGVTGELHVCGAGLAHGYLNQPELTKERFIPNPFVTKADNANCHGLLYRTGDLVRWLPDGNLEFIARNDDQVKIRGYRIEIGEIEHVLSGIRGIKQSCVVVKERKTETGNNKWLAGYYVLDDADGVPSATAILEKLSQVLPEYMVPAVLVAMESFPLTANGKLDKRALPEPDFSLTLAGYAAPANEAESEICKIWQGVLGLEQVGVTDDFFRIGGNSILAIQVTHRMSKVTGYDVKVADVFKYKTISRMLRRMAGRNQVTIPKVVAGKGLLSFAQERLWFIEQYEQGTNAYHIPQVYELAAAADIAGIKYGLQQVVARHEALRSTIEQGVGGGLQQVHEEPLLIEEISLTDNEEFESIIRADINRPFNLGSAYPIRVKFYFIGSGEEAGGSGRRTLLLINVHHIASDGWSTEIFQRELFAYYNAFIKKDNDFCLPAPEIQYKDYAAWQKNYLTGAILENQLTYWKGKLSGYQRLELPADYPRPKMITYRGSSEEFRLSSETSRHLRGLARRLGVTMNSVLLSGINILLGKYTGQADIVIGIPIANRHHRQTEGLIGFFVNTLVSRTMLSKTQSFDELVLQVHRAQIEAQLHQDLPFEKLVDELGNERDITRHPVFQVMFAMHSMSGQESATELQKPCIVPYRLPDIYEVEKFDLSIFIEDGEQELKGQVSYAADLFKKDTIIRLTGYFTHLLDQLAKSPQSFYSQVSLLSTAEYRQIVYKWNDTSRDYPKDKTIHQLFQEQVDRTPGNIALVYEGQQLEYKELNEKSNQLARHIRAAYKQRTQQELAPDTPIALFLDRSREIVTGILAVLKAGGAYVPIDISYPQERIDYILKDTHAELILSRRHVAEGSYNQLPQDKVIYIDLAAEFYKEEDIANLPQHSKASDLAYVIYTSGTTGKPNGVMVEHRAVSSLIFNDFIKVSASDIFTFLSSPVFDAATFELWMPLLNGNTLVIPNDIKSIVASINVFSNFISINNISILWLTKTLFESLYYSDKSIFERVKYLITGGEALDKNTVNELISGNKKPGQLINGYGPTESTTFACTYNLTDQVTSFNVPIGKPINNRTAYVLDAHNNAVPIGVIGELCIGGAGLARGYMNRPALTNERFIPNPFATDADRIKGYTRLYKTGDLVRWLPDGNLEFIGRNDDQIKIRGYRIELCEIEHALCGIAGIKQSCVLARESKTDTGSNKYLVGYYVPEKTKGVLSAKMIKEKLSQVLPAYMIPTGLVEMESFPLTVNGKLDKHAFPEPKYSVSLTDFVAPGTETEKALVHIWSEVLNIEEDQISIEADFFELGGHSMLVTKAVLRMNKLLGIEMPIRHFFERPTIAHLAQHKTDRQGKNKSDVAASRLYTDALLPENIQPIPGSAISYLREKILLTGATGFLGAYLLSDLLNKTKAKIYCLVRSRNTAEGYERVIANLKKYGLEQPGLHHRICVFASDLSLPQLGLTVTEYNYLTVNIDSIIHNGAYVHHIYNYEVLRNSNVGSTLEILKLATTNKTKRVFYISTLNAGMDVCNLPYIKESFVNSDLPSPSSCGYVQTKWVSEKLLSQANKRGIPVTIFRPPLITGHSKTGNFPFENDHFWKMIKGCIQMGAAPDWKDKKDMMPVDALSNIITEICIHTNSNGTVFNIANPDSIPWPTLIDWFNAEGYPLKLIPEKEWRNNYLSAIDTDNALYPLLPLYLMEDNELDEISKENQSITIEINNTLSFIKGLKLNCPIVDRNVIQNYISFLNQNNFI